MVDLPREDLGRKDIDYATPTRAFTLTGRTAIDLPHRIFNLVTKPGFSELVAKILLEPEIKPGEPYIPARELMQPGNAQKVRWYLSEDAGELILPHIQEAPLAPI